VTPDAVLDVMQRVTWISMEVAGPVLGVGLVVGLVMGLLQAATQISEPALTFVPKLLALAGTLAFLGSWIIERLTSFGRSMFEAVALVGS
jgi:flagellar biosynthetic protein FliQ